MILSSSTGYCCFKYTTFSSSSSTALKVTPGSSTKYFVSAPPPGPTSSRWVNGHCCNASTILRQTFSSFKKCCPSDFFNVYIGTKVRQGQRKLCCSNSFGASAHKQRHQRCLLNRPLLFVIHCNSLFIF